ncbi:MAG: uroporphyrinogen-III C-methyltransferase [Pirellulales bacterium]|nr:uroporphyrinogen-III C-methyltransferase [Pirellulales bacterium]
MQHPPIPATVYLVGAGPGDPGLITIRGAERLAKADLVLYDYLVNPSILRFAPRTAELICLGGHRLQRILSQDEINLRMVEAARRGRTVVRLKGGDPDVFGRSAEETEALRAAGIPYETVPGVTAALAAAGYAGIPITHAHHASAVALVAGQERREKQGPLLDYEALADFPGTLVIYMGVTSARQWSEAMLRRGKPADTPVAIVRRCSWNDQQTLRCTLGTVADVIAERKLRPPAVIVVGEVVSLASEGCWFTSRPLFGKKVLVTRPRDQAEEMMAPLTDLGAEVLVQPAIEISAPADWTPVDQALSRLHEYDWLVYSSSNGVRGLLDRLLEIGGDLRRLGNVKLAAIGPGTADELREYRLRADLVPAEYRAEALAESLAAGAAGKRFLLARASRGREVLADTLRTAGATVDQVVVYRSTDVEHPDQEIAEGLAAGRIDWVTVTSSAIAASLVRMFGDALRTAKLASISPVTSGALAKLGFPPAAEARQYTVDGLIEAILRSGDEGKSTL